MHVKQWLMIGTLTGGALLTGAWFGTAAQADSGGGAQINGTTIYTEISVSEPGAGSGWRQAGASNWTPPACWLEPWPGGFGVSPGDTPAEFANFMTALDGFASTQGSSGNLDGGADQWDALYQDGKGDDPIVHMIAPPYNTGQNGYWYGIACSTDSAFSDLQSFINSLHLTNSYEDWFFVTNGKGPAGVPTISPELLAEYAASKVRLPTDWPTAKPPLNVAQTVQLPTGLSSAADYQQYSVTASLAGFGSSTVTATPAYLTVSAQQSGVLKSPNSVTCTFAGNSLGGCDLTFIKSSNGGTFGLTAAMTWNVTWGGAGGVAGWTRQVTENLGQQNVLVQEIQTIVNAPTTSKR